MHSRMILFAALLILTACDPFTPRDNVHEKTASYDPEMRSLKLPQPCPDWSQSQTMNYNNLPHSNYGCAVNTNLAVQIENPEDLQHGHGKSGPDAGISIGVIEQYRAGKLPVPLKPLQSKDSSSSQ